jgi:hypothetical protein
MATEHEDIEEIDDRVKALAAHLECEPDEISEARYGDNTFHANGGDYLVLTDDEADAVFRERCISYVDDCLEIPEKIRPYFDEDRWIQDCRISDGRGHVIGSYDGAENEQRIGDIWYYIYRTN